MTLENAIRHTDLLELTARGAAGGAARIAGAGIRRPDSLEPPADDQDGPGGSRWTNGMPQTLRLERVDVRRRYINALNVRNAARDLERLPEPGGSVHVIMRGNWHGWDLVPAVLRLAGGPAIRRLYVATLGFNEANARELATLLDAGRVQAVRFVCSVYFRDTTRTTHDLLARLLEERGQVLLAMRNHAKVLAMELEDGRAFVSESSANLRSCRNVEQFSLSHDPDLFAFHAAWIDQQIAEGGARR